MITTPSASAITQPDLEQAETIIIDVDAIDDIDLDSMDDDLHHDAAATPTNSHDDGSVVDLTEPSGRSNGMVAIAAAPSSAPTAPVANAERPPPEVVLIGSQDDDDSTSGSICNFVWSLEPSPPISANAVCVVVVSSEDRQLQEALRLSMRAAHEVNAPATTSAYVAVKPAPLAVGSTLPGRSMSAAAAAAAPLLLSPTSKTEPSNSVPVSSFGTPSRATAVSTKVSQQIKGGQSVPPKARSGLSADEQLAEYRRLQSQRYRTSPLYRGFRLLIATGVSLEPVLLNAVELRPVMSVAALCVVHYSPDRRRRRYCRPHRYIPSVVSKWSRVHHVLRLICQCRFLPLVDHWFRHPRCHHRRRRRHSGSTTPATVMAKSSPNYSQ